ncbi:MAG: ISAs1 family transposase [Streptomycetales bacterium]
MFLVGAIAHGSGAVLGQRQVPSKRGEGPAARQLLSGLDVAGMVLTLDALHTTKTTARLITQDLGAHYVLILKGNQPLAHAAAQTLLTGPDTEWAHTTASHDDQGHGRTERRTIRTATCDDDLFPGAHQAFRLRRDAGGLDGAWTSEEIVHGITSLPADLATPAHLKALRARLLGRGKPAPLEIRDTLYQEDKSQLRTRSGPRIMASLRNLAISALRLAGRHDTTEATRWASRKMHRPFTILGLTA